MSVQLLLSRNSSNLDLVDSFLNSITNYYDDNTPITRVLDLTTNNGVETVKGTVTINDTVFTKTNATNYSSAVVNDQTFINNLSVFISSFQLNIVPLTVNLDGNTYYCNSYITLGPKRFYILYNQPASTESTSQ
jgi:hypothetical protein